jgi:hypothetical protein
MKISSQLANNFDYCSAKSGEIKFLNLCALGALAGDESGPEQDYFPQ